MSEEKDLNLSTEDKNISNSFAGRLLDKIKEKKLSPKPRWQFLLKNYTVYIAGILALLIGAVAVSVIIYLVRFNDWNFYYHTDKSFWEFLLLTAPYFWLLFLGLFIFIVYYNFKHTQKGYRYPNWLLVGASISLSIILGVAFFRMGLGEKIDDALGRRAPFYGHILNPQIDFWSHPEEGRLFGLIIGKGEEESLILLDRELEEWAVYLDMPIREKEYSSVRQPVRLIGREMGDNSFMAEKIFVGCRSGKGFFQELENRPRMNRPRVIMIENGLNDSPSSIFPMPRY